jgi:hypothetical protein
MSCVSHGVACFAGTSSLPFLPLLGGCSHDAGVFRGTINRKWEVRPKTWTEYVQEGEAKVPKQRFLPPQYVFEVYTQDRAGKWQLKTLYVTQQEYLAFNPGDEYSGDLNGPKQYIWRPPTAFQK